MIDHHVLCPQLSAGVYMLRLWCRMYQVSHAAESSTRASASVLVVMAQLVYAPVVTQIITRMDCVISLSQAPYSVQLISTLNKMSVALQPDVFFSFSGTQGAVSIDSPQSEYVFLPL